MNDLKQAYQLAMNELRTSKMNYIGSIIFYLLISLFFLFVDGKASAVGWIINDILLIIIFCFAPYYLKPKEFQMQKVSGELWAAPSVVWLQQLPIKRNVIMRSRLIIYSFYSLPPQIILLVALYAVSSDYRGLMSPSNYIIFSIFWISLGISTGFQMAASDVGSLINPKSICIAIITIIANFAVFILIFYHLLDEGIVRWTIFLAKDWPILSIIISFIVIILSIKYVFYYMKKQMKKLDYL